MLKNKQCLTFLKKFGFYENKLEIRLKSAGMRDALYDLPKAIDKIRNLTLPTIESEGLNFYKTSNIIDMYTRLEILLGLKLSGHTTFLTEASNLLDELYKGGEKRNEQQYRNAPNNFYI